MNFTLISTLLPLIAEAAPGLNENSAIDELRRAARTLCQQALVSQETQESAFTAGDTTLSYDSPDPTQVYVHRVMWVTCPRGNIPVETLAFINERFPNWRSLPGGSPCVVANENDGELALYPSVGTSNAESPVHIRLACAPTLAATKLDTSIVNQYAEDIANGALARILRMPKQTWTEPAAAADHSARFEQAISAARAQATLDRSVTSIKPVIRRW